jgi:hypothetical protein
LAGRHFDFSLAKVAPVSFTPNIHKDIHWPMAMPGVEKKKVV